MIHHFMITEIFANLADGMMREAIGELDYASTNRAGIKFLVEMLSAVRSIYEVCFLRENVVIL